MPDWNKLLSSPKKNKKKEKQSDYQSYDKNYWQTRSERQWAETVAQFEHQQDESFHPANSSPSDNVLYRQLQHPADPHRRKRKLIKHRSKDKFRTPSPSEYGEDGLPDDLPEQNVDWRRRIESRHSETDMDYIIPGMEKVLIDHPNTEPTGELEDDWFEGTNKLKKSYEGVPYLSKYHEDHNREPQSRTPSAMVSSRDVLIPSSSHWKGKDRTREVYQTIEEQSEPSSGRSSQRSRKHNDKPKSKVSSTKSSRKSAKSDPFDLEFPHRQEGGSHGYDSQVDY